MKLFPIRTILQGKKIVLIDDSLVRGTTSKKIVKLLKDNGAKEVHLALSSPKVISPCFYGINTPTKEELIAHQMTVEEIKKYIDADSLTFLELDNMACAAASPKRVCGFCAACFTGQYPTGIKLKDKPKQGAC
ncbi:MAG: hypothetical protein LBM71_03315 [Elusimicrobiota bacterium]|jgi:amidophosphoribosyltransferase|nr:hypothetical protein [Elusimicrobiota bacterium]